MSSQFNPNPSQLEILNQPLEQSIIQNRKVQKSRPLNFVNIVTFCPNILFDLRYPTSNNFTNSIVDGYNSVSTVYMTKEAAMCLNQCAEYLSQTHNYGLRIFDSYRPFTSVQYFVKWSRDELSNTFQSGNRTEEQEEEEEEVQQLYYPSIPNKTQLFDLGYIAHFSGHSRGSTVDLVIYDKQTGKDLEMGTIFDFFGEESHHDNANDDHDDNDDNDEDRAKPRSLHDKLIKFGHSEQIVQEILHNRLFFKTVMKKFNFKHYDEEWWHYTLIDEPYPDTFFDFLINDLDPNDVANISNDGLNCIPTLKQIEEWKMAQKE
jgi:D-alanyl-D-alanine dipeptidase